MTPQCKQFILATLNQQAAQLQQKLQMTLQAIAELEKEAEPCTD